MKSIYNLFILLIIAAAISSSCKKAPGPGKVILTVVDTLSKPVSGATVEFTSKTYNARSIIYDKQTTSSDGQVFYSLDKEAILDVIVRKDTMIANDIVRISLGETTTRTITLR